MRCSAAHCTRSLDGTVVHENAAPRVPGQLKVYHLQCWLQEIGRRSHKGGGAPPSPLQEVQEVQPRPVRLRTTGSHRRDRELWERWYVEKEGSA
ncbi:MAG: hypothetical protein QMD46_12190 [Methanomicrobiales archaeon]|nr:hypothetical protein [Methanomicrobiales archaeon]